MYKVEDRVGLDEIENSEWSKSFEKYLNDTQVDGLDIQSEREIQIEKLLSLAIRYEYADNCKYIYYFKYYHKLKIN